MFKKIALATITAAALVAPPSLVHAGVTRRAPTVAAADLRQIRQNGVSSNGHNLNDMTLNGIRANGVEPAGREVYVVGERAGGESSTVITIELPQSHVGR